MIRCDELLGKKVINSYYEFLFAMALAAECGRRGTALDMTMVTLHDKGMFSPDDIAYMHYLKDIGSIYDGTLDCGKYKRDSVEDVPHKRPRYFFDVNAIDDLYSELFKEEEDCYHWSTAYAFDTYDKYTGDLLNKKRVGNTIMHLMAHMYVCFKLKERPQKPVKFSFKTYEVATIYMYLNLLACSKYLDVLKGLAIIDLDENYSDNIGDIDFNILFDTAMHAKRLKKWSCADKFKAFKEYGFEKGSIAVLYERDKISESNPVGNIVRASIIRIDDYNDDLYSRAGWNVTKFSVNKTIEEIEDDYYGIDEEYRSAFSDLLKPTLGQTSSFLAFEGVGIGSYFLDEEFLILPIERDEKVLKKVSIDGKTAMVELDDVEIIYWILNQYKVNFDKGLYKKYYNSGKPLMWDKYDCTPVHRKVEKGNSESEDDYSAYDD